MSSLSPIVYYPSPINITKKEQKFIDKTFERELQTGRQKSTVRRNDDNGYGAALTCLARDMVTATPEETRLIAAKMNFLQMMINQNIQTDAGIKTQQNEDYRALITTKSDAYTAKAPHQVEIIKATAGGVNDVVNTVTDKIFC